MFSAYDSALVMVAVGVALMLSPVYFYPHGGPRHVTQEFRADRVAVAALDDADVIDLADADVLLCTGTIHRRACLLERRIGPNGTLSVDDTTLYRDEDGDTQASSDYQYVYLDGGFYEPRVSEANGSAMLRLQPVNKSTVTRRLATEIRWTHPVVRRAVKNGSAKTTVTITEREPQRTELDELRDAARTLVRSDDEYYVVHRVGYENRPVFLAKYLGLVQTAAVFVGGGLIFIAFQFPRVGSGGSGRT